MSSITEASAPAWPVAEPVCFFSDDARLAGNLYYPVDGPAGRRPAIVVTGTWTSVKEQMANRYAAQLARRGLIALSFDFAGFGMSGGELREVESAERKARDIRNAVSFLANHLAVNGEQIGALAVCASAMYAALAATMDDRIRSLALVAPWLHDALLVEEVYGGAVGVRERLRAADKAAARYQRTGVVEYVPVVDPDDPRAAMSMAADFYLDPARGKLPEWPNRFAVMAWREWLMFDAIALADRIRKPTLIVHSETAAIPDGARRFYAALRRPKRLVWQRGTQFDFYDDPDTVDQAVAHAADHFQHTLDASVADYSEEQ